MKEKIYQWDINTYFIWSEELFIVDEWMLLRGTIFLDERQVFAMNSRLLEKIILNWLGRLLRVAFVLNFDRVFNYYPMEYII